MELNEIDTLGDDELCELLSAAVAEYSSRVQRAVDGGARPAPPLDRDRVTPTDVVIVAGKMLESFDIAPFELATLKY